MSGSAVVLRADALRLPLPDESVDLIVSSPPYFALRSYRDGDEHYAGQIGSEPTPQAFLEALWAVMHECWRVLKPSGSCFINLGDKRAGSGGHNNAGLKPGGTAAADMRAVRSAQGHPVRLQATRRNTPDRYNQAAFGRPKSKMLLPHRFAIGCEDGLADPEGKGWVMRSDIVWQKLNGLPESVTDRVRDSHEYLFHLTKSERYFAGVDEVREGYAPGTAERYAYAYTNTTGDRQDGTKGQGMMRAIANGEGGPTSTNPLGKLPGSVWPLASEPLIVSDEVKAHYDLPDHFAAFPTELVRRVILGWSPSGVCVECGEGRRPVVAKTYVPQGDHDPTNGKERYARQEQGTGDLHMGRFKPQEMPHGRANLDSTITGYSCRCGIPASPTSPAVVLDIFGGTGTTAGVARALGRIGVSVDLSHDYSRLADWRIHRSGHFAKVVNRTHRENQGGLFGVPA